MMGTKADKKFDCVEMKNRIQQDLLREYERRKDEFSSYGDFIRRTVAESDEIRQWRTRMRKESTG